MRRGLGGAFLLSATVAGLGACGSSTSSASHGTTAPRLSAATPTTTTSATSAPSTTPAGFTGTSGAATASFTVKDPSQGYTALVRVSWGPLRHATAQDVASTGTSERMGYCGLNVKTDAVMPFQLQMTNTTSGFDLLSEGAGLTVLDENSAYKGPTIWVFEHQGATTECGQVLASLYTYSLAPGATVSVRGFLEFASYFSPATPSGSPSVLSQLALEAQSDLPWDTSAPSSGLLGFHTFSSAGTPDPLLPLMPGTLPPCGSGESCS
jgi:hypothetical protein